VYHVGFLDDVVRILRCVCHHCSKLLIDQNDHKAKRALDIRDPATRMRAIHDLSRAKKRCEPGDVTKMTDFMQEMGLEKEVPGGGGGGGEDVMVQAGCGGMLPTYLRKELGIEMNFPENMEDIPGTGDRKQRLSAKRAYEILRNISDEDAVKLGLNPKYARPEWLVVSVLPVPPPHVRPSVEMDGKRAEDDLTHVLSTIIKNNITLENGIMKGEPAHVIEQFEQLLQFKVTAFFDNERPDMPRESQRSGRPLKTLKQRLKGKEGRLRGNLMGKRVDFSARTVITADPNLAIDQVGVPRSIALRLTTPVTVTPFNINELTGLVEKGSDVWPGANYIIRSDQRRIDLRYASKNDKVLEFGWCVERHLQDDDIVLFNRQPSLHKMSIMGHRAKILDWSTFRLNLSVTTPYNADFDGDEMNLHLPQSLTAKADAQELMMVPRNIITPQSNRNVMGIVQDALLGCTRMTHRDIFIEKEVFMNAMMWMATWDGLLPQPAILKPRPLWTGKQLISMVTPKINYKGKSKNHPNNAKDVLPFNLLDSDVLLLDGQVIMGILDKNIIGNSGGSVVHVCQLQDGWQETRRFMGEIQCVVNYWMANTSYTVGVADTVADKSTMNQIQNTLDEAKVKVRNLMERAQRGELTGQPGKTLMESFEHNVNTVLNAARETAGKAAQASLLDRNAIKGTVMAGSKGSFLNISQIIACVGQQNVQGSRIKYGFKQRTLPHFGKDDLGMESRGFVENSYLRGLSPTEFYFHAMGGREGCIDTAVKTSETGYIQRRLVKAMESVMARYDSTVRNSLGCVIQFLYGEDGMNAQHIERQKLDSYLLNEHKFRNRFYMDVNSDSFGVIPNRYTVNNEPAYYIAPELVHMCRGDSELRAALEEEYAQLQRDRADLRVILACRGPGEETNDMVYLPVNLDRLIWNAQRTYGVDPNSPTNLHPRTVLDCVQRLSEKVVVVRGDDPFSREAQYNATLLFKIHLRSKLGCKRVLKDYRLNEAALNFLEGAIETDFMQAIVHPGEMAGVLAAQSIGEPATQMTLNTFHNSGISAKNVTLGVPRLNELLNVAQHVKTPSLTIYMNEEYAFDEDKVDDMQSFFEFTTLGNITVKTEIHYDPDVSTSVIESDSKLVKTNYMITMGADSENLSPWVLRIVFNKTLFLAKKMKMDDIETKILEFFGNNVQVICSVDNADELVARIRIVISPEDRQHESEDVAEGSDDHEFLRRMQKQLIEQLHLQGIPGIKKVFRSQKAKPSWNDITGEFDNKDEWIMETDGTNLSEILMFPMIDHRRTISNDVCEMFAVLGIEGVRASLFHELRNLLSFDSAYVNYRHIACLADSMTFSGGIMAVSRHGINRSEAGPLLRASFEETVEVLMQAALLSQYDVLDGVTENIMLGQLARVGSGIVDLLMDDKKLQYALDYETKIGNNVNDFLASGPTPIASTPNQSSPWGIMGSSTPAMGSFSPSQTPQYGSSSPAYFQGGASPGPSGVGGQSPYHTQQAHYFASMKPGMGGGTPSYAAMSPGYSPTSASYTPSGSGSNYSYPASPAYSPSSPAYSPSSPAISPASPAYSPATPGYSPSSPSYSPLSPAGYSPNSPAYSPMSPGYSPVGTPQDGSNNGYSPAPTGNSTAPPAYSPVQE
jgi:DNA-directed RNA polymerase II subunit RPB1